MGFKKQLTAIIVGNGHRSMGYARRALSHPDELKIVGVADPDHLRVKLAVDTFGLSADQCWGTAAELAAKPKRADFIINGTMDHQHVPTSVPLLESGYDMLLEKPFATSEDELRELVGTARRHKRQVLICHVLRYAPFYRAVFDRIASGEIGQIMNIQTLEHISYHHMAIGFIRGKWNREDTCHSGTLMSKCCHDLDIIAWMKSGIAPRSVSSFGSLMHFNEEHAPEGAGDRCIVDCPIEKDCLYSARKQHLDHPDRWSFYVWAGLEHIEEPTDADREEWLRTGPFGKCAWKSDNTVVDHQSVAIEFDDGSTATHNLVGGTARGSRAIYALGTDGEIQSVFEDSTIIVRHADPRPGKETSEEVIDLRITGDMHGAQGGHGGGDERLMADCLNAFAGRETSPSITALEDSISGHMIGFCAEKARLERRVVDVPGV